MRGSALEDALPRAAEIVADVRARGDAALLDWSERLDGERPASLRVSLDAARLDEAALRDDPVLAALDPGLDSVVNVNEPDDYRTAREQPAPQITIRRFGVLAGADGHRAPQTVRAATVAEAAAAAGVDLGHVTAALNGDQITRDGQTPLAAGDTVFFLSADAGG